MPEGDSALHLLGNVDKKDELRAVNETASEDVTEEPSEGVVSARQRMQALEKRSSELIQTASGLSLKDPFHKYRST